MVQKERQKGSERRTRNVSKTFFYRPSRKRYMRILFVFGPESAGHSRVPKSEGHLKRTFPGAKKGGMKGEVKREKWCETAQGLKGKEGGEMREKGGRKGVRKHTRKTLILVPLWFRYSLVAFQLNYEFDTHIHTSKILSTIEFELDTHIISPFLLKFIFLGDTIHILNKLSWLTNLNSIRIHIRQIILRNSNCMYSCARGIAPLLLLKHISNRHHPTLSQKHISFTSTICSGGHASSI